MKKGIITTFLIICVFCGFAQTQTSMKIKLSEVDKSPMDMAYFPADYPMLKIKNKAVVSPVARVIYSRPQVDNRVIFGELIEYNKVWRLGANEATEIEFFKDVMINGKKVAKGRYTLYAIPNPAQWTIIFNKDTDTWGAFVYSDKKDVVRVDVPVQTLADPAEVFTMSFDKTDNGANLFIAWEKVSVTLPITIK